LKADGWLNTSQYECDWYGCWCEGDNKTIESISLRMNRLRGRFSSPAFELGLLRDALRFVDLEVNGISGYFPSEIGQLTYLEFLALSDNSFTGTLPTEVGELKLLRYLYNGMAKLTGRLPTEIGSLSSLRRCSCTGTGSRVLCLSSGNGFQS
jgi:hypothetical protein